VEVPLLKQGPFLIATVQAALNHSSHGDIEVTAKDHGTGIADVRLALQDGFSTSGGLGLGLPRVKRLVDEFQIISNGKGTVVTFKKWKF
jgi:serine/threonine-protein kinase RsbT